MANKALTAEEIFDQFQSRRELLSRAGKLGIAAGLPTMLAACLELPDNAFSEGPTDKEIQIVNGRNCWENQCFYFNQRDGEISVAGREPIAAPSKIDLRKGYVTEAEFNELLMEARKASMEEASNSSGVGSGNNGDVSNDAF
jgi:hypothetical protein